MIWSIFYKHIFVPIFFYLELEREVECEELIPESVKKDEDGDGNDV